MPHLPIQPSLYSIDKLVIPLGNEKWSKVFESQKLHDIFVSGRVEDEQIQ